MSMCDLVVQAQRTAAGLLEYTCGFRANMPVTVELSWQDGSPDPEQGMVVT